MSDIFMKIFFSLGWLVDGHPKFFLMMKNPVFLTGGNFPMEPRTGSLCQQDSYTPEVKTPKAL